MDVHLYNGACARLGVKCGQRKTLNFKIKSPKSPALRAGDKERALNPSIHYFILLNGMVDSCIYFKSTSSGAQKLACTTPLSSGILDWDSGGA
jgi:hypothetical protein